MNDLAEKAWHGALAVGRAVRDHPMRSFGLSGLVAGSVAVVAGGQVAARASSRPFTAWLGLASTHGVSTGDAGSAVALLVAVVLLVGLWIGLVETVRRQGQPLRRVWTVAGAWALPFVLGPPLMDTSVDSYVAYARLERLGRDPYVSRPLDLGTSPVVTAIDPVTRGDQSSAGPLGTLLQHFAISVSGGGLTATLIVFRVMGVLAAFAIGRGAVRLASPSAAPDTTRGTALALCALNPLVLLYVVSSPHLEGVTVALLLSAAVAARRRRWPRALVLASLAGTVTTVGFVAVPVIVAVHLTAHRQGRWWRALGLDVVVAAVPIALLRLAVPDGFGWVRTVRGQFDQHTPFAVADAVGRLLSPVVRAASYDDLAAGGWVTAAAAAACVIGYLVLTPRERGVEAGIGYGLLALALLAPVLHPWYLMWGVLVFAPTASGMRRTWVQALTAAGCVLTPPGFGTTTTYVVTGIGLGVVTVVTAAVLRAQDRAAGAADGGSAAPADLADGRPDVGQVDAGDHRRRE
ncbi:polyprenol phosphomannose-dependent alpha 1,6 mannosyltransferase MptB [Jatrophihabitans endophyticus]|uniref:polyprenol phosphomannose-dependent alpha 1,6 mannosyltransferase MptB n=1 Tax=Jatrophihabitans endophyticus TaxID=1206085 RepID=UPI0019FBB4B5|nr:polyprenol phosphomannose-dependent alpha 1,6 mannosyltransferase MptB [Jatrophihabitans endophyticus]MBE7189134.1 polyprenol phosphomannose-dependent alpha 1,6 mannosyltransferase MptB [Jatrophihabitans endophyticus]